MLEILFSEKSPNEIPYVDLFCAAMAFPLVTPEDLDVWISSFEPHAKLILDGSSKRRKPSCDQNDRVQVLSKIGLARLQAP